MPTKLLSLFAALALGAATGAVAYAGVTDGSSSDVTTVPASVRVDDSSGVDPTGSLDDDGTADQGRGDRASVPVAVAPADPTDDDGTADQGRGDRAPVAGRAGSGRQAARRRERRRLAGRGGRPPERSQ